MTDVYDGYQEDLDYLTQYRDDGDENVRLLEPLLAFRLAKAYRRSRRMRDHVRIESAGRTRAEQKYLYDGYKAGRPGFNLAANPDRIIGRHAGTTFLGSWHMEQPDGHTYAVDLTHHGTQDWQHIHEILRSFGLHTTVRGEREPWHHQATTIRGPLPGPFPDDLQPEEDPLTPELEEKLEGLATWFFNGVKLIIDKLDEVLDAVKEAKK